MPYFLNGTQLRVGKSFRGSDGTWYPNTFLRNATQAEKDALGITWQPDPVPVDTRFYWDHNLPKRLEDEPAVNENGDPVLDEDGVQIINRGLKTEWIAKQKEIAGTLLAPSDWYVTRKAETGVEIPADVLTYRQSVRTVCNNREAEIAACVATEELAALVTSSPVVYVEATGKAEPNPEPFITPWPDA